MLKTAVVLLTVMLVGSFIGFAIGAVVMRLFHGPFWLALVLTLPICFIWGFWGGGKLINLASNNTERGER